MEASDPPQSTDEAGDDPRVPETTVPGTSGHAPAEYQATPATATGEEITRILNAVANGSDQVQAIVQTPSAILKDGLRKEEFMPEMAAAIRPEFPSTRCSPI